MRREPFDRRAASLNCAPSRIIVRTPFIGDNIFHAEMGELYEFTVAVGDVVAADDTIAVVDTHKASIDIRTPHSGTVARLLVDAGTEVYESQPVLALTGPSANPASA
ncbi:hypothetical protein JL722_7014 [Aureococcus anophagefferens]|nr:hypothetical protein JL722_7014 [Aureococcus anophagefferens]